jgi:AraC family transcriptional regulator
MAPATAAPSRAPAFFGHAEHVRQIGGLVVMQNRYVPNQRLRKHTHQRAFISFVIAGSYIEYCDNRPIRCPRGTLIFHPSGEEHSDMFESQEAILLGIEVDDGHVPDLKLFGSRHVMNGPEKLVAHQIAHEIKEQCSVSNLVVESLVAELLSNCRQGSGRRGTPRWLGTAIEIANERYAGCLGLTEVAAAAGVHPVHLARQFRLRMGCTFGEFVRRIRTARALAQLRSTSASIAEIAAATGFADQSHLTRLITASVGLSPAVYRREASRNALLTSQGAAKARNSATEPR